MARDPEQEQAESLKQLVDLKSQELTALQQVQTGVNRLGTRTSRVQLRRSESTPGPQQAFWSVIRNRTIDFNQYKTFIDDVMCCVCDPTEGRESLPKEKRMDLRLPFPGVRSYNLLKLATELYLMQECGVVPRPTAYGHATQGKLSQPCVSAEQEFDKRFNSAEETSRMEREEEVTAAGVLTELRTEYLKDLEDDVTAGGPFPALPYLKIIREKLADIPLKDPRAVPNSCYGILPSKLSDPCLLELIWSYWHEEGMLV